MKTNTTAAAKATKKFSQQKPTIGLDLGIDRVGTA
jgi:hypothetical protein